MPLTPDEIEAAAGRLRRLAAGESVDAVYLDLPPCYQPDAVNTDRRDVADAWLARPLTVPVGTPGEVAAARARIARVICDGESREVVFGTADWLPLARADNNLVGRDDAQRWRLKDPVYQQGYNDGLLAATAVPPADLTDPTPEVFGHVPHD